MAQRKKKPPSVDLSAVQIKAGAIGFDSFGRIIVDKSVQAEAGGFHLPPWLGGGGGGGPTVDAACGNAACVPESVCGDAACEPESVCTDAACEPESVCADAACEPESICTDAACGDIACEPESICTDATCEPESKCVDIFCKEKNAGCEINNGCTGGETPPVDVEPL